MRAAIMNAPFDMTVGEWETPLVGSGEVLVSVSAAGICAGDLYFYLGKNPYAIYPQICGHEISGTIAAVDASVEGLERGMPVVVEPFIGCGTCYPCRIGKANCCANLRIIGVHRPGGFAEYVTAPAENIHRVPDGVPLLDAAFVEPVAIGVQACRRGDVKPGEYVLILGCGPIGLALIEIARSRGARVVASDLDPERMEAARRFGAETMPGGDGLLDAVMEQTSSEGAPVVIEATGSPQAMEQTVDLVAAGGRIVILGLLRQGQRISLPGLDLTRKEMTIVGSRASVGCFPEALELMARGTIAYPSLAAEFDLWDAPAVMAKMAADPTSVLKGVFVVHA